MFRTLSLAACLLFVALLPARAAEEGAIRQVIENQLQAFQRDDGSAAFSYASPTIQRIFDSPQRFMQMVKQGYDPVYRPRSYSFTALEPAGPGDAVQFVEFVDQNGLAWRARYFMQRQDDGSWRINGVSLEQLPDLSV